MLCNKSTIAMSSACRSVSS